MSLFRRIPVLLAAVAALAAVVVTTSASATVTTHSASVTAHSASGYGCSDPYPSTRNPQNPLMLSTTPPAGDPLRGAQFFVDGPRHGAAAGAIAQLLGLKKSDYADNVSWATFSQQVARILPSKSATVRHDVTELEKIASQPEPQRLSAYSQGGSPAGLYSQTTKLFCHNFTADPGTIPIINTYFLHGTLHGCPTPAKIRAYRPKFEGQINAIARATGNRPVVWMLELDYLGSSTCISKDGAMPGWESLMRYEVKKLGGLPHAVTYIEAGYSDSNSPSYTAARLNRSGIRSAEGFYTNDTHLQWTTHEIAWGDKVSRLTHGAHFVVNTALNGRGPKLNPHPGRQGVEDLCNAPGRGLGPMTDTNTGFNKVDGFLWVIIPGNSSGCGGGPPGGVFWPARAIGLAERAQDKLGPGYPNNPY